MKKLLLIVPSLHQGGLEKVCAATARLLQPYFDVQIAIFDSRNIAYDIKGIPVTDLRLPSRPHRIGKIINVLKRGWKLRCLKKEKRLKLPTVLALQRTLRTLRPAEEAKNGLASEAIWIWEIRRKSGCLADVETG